jgi:hypothetical protein
MVLCWLVYRLGEQRLRTQLAATGQTVAHQPSSQLIASRCAGSFACVEGISLVVFPPTFEAPRRAIATLKPLHQVLAFLRYPGSILGGVLREFLPRRLRKGLPVWVDEAPDASQSAHPVSQLAS